MNQVALRPRPRPLPAMLVPSETPEELRLPYGTSDDRLQSHVPPVPRPLSPQKNRTFAPSKHTRVGKRFTPGHY